ncbi:NAD/FAD-dependent oxidoreductase [Coraliomargarita sinensis]|uniref:NAD/FAD-dependent oxidoreductase n=1 Tax=Coraliomargarita sinensis TaxID=2174842 RepID=A0A317ZLZ8_9BACT|nr:FAD-dependent oxidoreductase [Coraliomargarita sinensis]PXA05197.1 NAD/FAD-dependent oxidoreductase [Coraliomargarita sinensis]
MSHTDVIIIGAGISGLLCATELQRAGMKVRLVDKGRGFGGRMATRRMAGGRLDHGAQFFTVRDRRFQNYVDEWLEAGVIREWFRHSPKDSNPNGYPRYCGINGMTDAPKFLAKSLKVERSERIIELSRELDTWIVRSESGSQYTAGYLVITAPAPQALSLLDTTGLKYAGDDEAGLKAIRYAKGLATLAILDGPSALPENGIIQLFKSPLALIADNRVKEISPDVHAITIHADAEFAEQHWDSPNEVRGPLMLDAAEPLLGSQVVEYNCHRWGFTTPLNPWHEKHFTNASLRLTLAGDSFGGARVEGAALSGIEAAGAVLQNCGINLRGS